MIYWMNKCKWATMSPLYRFLEIEEDAIQKDIYWNTGLPLDIANRPDDVAIDRYTNAIKEFEIKKPLPLATVTNRQLYVFFMHCAKIFDIIIN